MKTVTAPRAVRESLRGERLAGRRIGFVPTMGALHEGHASLVRLARRRTDIVVVSIFVNPKQFGPREDFSRYPRDVGGDRRFLEDLGCDVLFRPTTAELYSAHDRTRISVENLSDALCGGSRPGHFQGVALIVAKLFNIVQPDEAYFGQKDAQQAIIVQRMAADLDVPVRIVLGPTVREPDGLAMSSRNVFLDPDERARAAAIPAALRAVRGRIERGERDPEPLVALMRRMMAERGIDVDYADIVDCSTLGRIRSIEGTVLVACAGTVGRTRLIDNVALSVSGSEVREVLVEFPEWSRYG
jgi:pantoate--beta-alanine ligase